MRKIIYVVVLIALTSCNHNNSNTSTVENTTEDSIMAILDSIHEDSIRAHEDSIRALEDTVKADSARCKSTREMTKEVYDYYVAYGDSVETVFQKLLKALPQYRKVFLKEKAVWEKYQDAVGGVSDCEDHMLSTYMWTYDVLIQGIDVRSVPLHYLYLHTKGKDMPHSKTKFTPTMIADAYKAYIKAVGENDYYENTIEQRTKYQESLRNEQRCWDDLLKCRKKTSQLLSGELKKVYDIGTNQMLRTKLFQLKNQNRDLGMTINEICECVLPKDCSDKALLKYPGFDKVWIKHSENLDWYPKFDY